MRDGRMETKNPEEGQSAERNIIFREDKRRWEWEENALNEGVRGKDQNRE